MEGVFELINMIFWVVVVIFAVWAPVFYGIPERWGYDSNIWTVLWLVVWCPLWGLIGIFAGGIL